MVLLRKTSGIGAKQRREADVGETLAGEGSFPSPAQAAAPKMSLGAGAPLLAASPETAWKSTLGLESED